MEKYKKVISRTIIVIFFISSILIMQYGTALTRNRAVRPGRDKTEILVIYKDSKKADTIRAHIKSKLSLARLDLKKKLMNSRIEVLRVEDAANIDRIIEEFKNDPYVEYAQRNYYYSATCTLTNS